MWAFEQGRGSHSADVFEQSWVLCTTRPAYFSNEYSETESAFAVDTDGTINSISHFVSSHTNCYSLSLKSHFQTSTSIDEYANFKCIHGIGLSPACTGSSHPCMLALWAVYSDGLRIQDSTCIQPYMYAIYAKNIFPGLLKQAKSMDPPWSTRHLIWSKELDARYRCIFPLHPRGI